VNRSGGYRVIMTVTPSKPPMPAMPALISDANGSASDRDPATSHEHAPIDDRPVRDPSGVDADEPVTVYARRLWTELEQVADYLRDQIARGGNGPLLNTDDQWQRWREVYGGVLSVLAGPHGDEGYGQQEAQVEFQNRPS
jgi:hypothetical protein